MNETAGTRTITVKSSDFMMALAVLSMRADQVRGEDIQSSTTYDDIRSRLLDAYVVGQSGFFSILKLPCGCDHPYRIQCHRHWREQNPTEHPIWCLYSVSGKLEPCDCDLSAKPATEPK